MSIMILDIICLKSFNKKEIKTMNNLRREKILKLVDKLSELREEFESIAVDAEEYILDNLNDAVSSLDDSIETLSYLTEN